MEANEMRETIKKAGEVARILSQMERLTPGCSEWIKLSAKVAKLLAK